MSVLKSPQETRGIAHVKARFADIFCHHGSGANYDAVTDIHRHNRRVGSYTDTVANRRAAPLLWLPGRAALDKWIINKHRAVRDKTVVADSHELTNECMGLDAAALTNFDSFLDLNEWTNEALVANLAAIEINGLDDSHVFSEPNIDNANRT